MPARLRGSSIAGPGWAPIPGKHTKHRLKEIYTVTNTTTVAAVPAPLFEIRQSAVDGQFRVWVQRSYVDLGIVDRAEYEAAGSPVFMNPTRWVNVAVFKTKPPVNTVLELLGVKPKQRKVAPRKQDPKKPSKIIRGARQMAAAVKGAA